MGWEGPDAEGFSTHIHGIGWERLAAAHQTDEIGSICPGAHPATPHLHLPGPPEDT